MAATTLKEAVGSSRLDEFVREIKESLPDNGCQIEAISNGKRFYFRSKDYGECLKKWFHEHDTLSAQFNSVPHYPDFMRICSVSSSARLCFLRYYREKGIQFEVELTNPASKNGKNNAQPDAKLGNTYYECKCQEIVNGEHETLKTCYKDCLKKYFGIKDIKENTYEDTISAHLTDFGIDYNEDYDKTHFNIKQLFTHLIAIAKKHPDKQDIVQLQYVFFTPSESKQGEATKKVYEELRAEINAIWTSKIITKTFKEVCPNIILLEPKYISVDEDCFGDTPQDILKSIDLGRKH